MDQDKRYKPRGAALELLKAKDREILYEGPAGTGKTRSVLEKIYILCAKYPDIRVLIVRKTYKSITQSIRVTWEKEVLTGFPPIKLNIYKQEYLFPNGSVVVIAGLNEPERTKSSQWDIIYVNEGTEITEVDYETLLRGLRNNQMPYQQAIVDCNPDAPTHWLNRRAERGEMKRIKGIHEDNPRLYTDTGEMTEEGEQYMSVLDSLTGVRYDRLRLGNWVAAEGMIYDEWSSEFLIPRFRIPAKWDRWITVDFGVNNPFVAQWWAHDPAEDILYLYREIYHTGRLVEDHAHQMHLLSANESFKGILCDHDLEGRLTLERHLPHRADECPGDRTTIWSTTKADKEVENGIQLVKMRLKRGGIRIFEDSLVELDPDLKKFGKPAATVEEFPGYVWDVVQSQRLGELNRDVPRKKDDHGMDSLRYMVKQIDDPRKRGMMALINGSHRMSVEGMRPDEDKSKWLAFFRS